MNDTEYSFGESISTFNNKLFLSYVGRNGPSVASSTDGVNFSYVATVSNIPYGNGSTDYKPGSSMTIFNGNLYVAYTTTSSGYLVVGRSPDGVTWTTQQLTMRFGHDPSLVAAKSSLYVLGQSVGSDHHLWTTGSTDGVYFPPSTQNGPQLNESPSSVNFDGSILVFFRSNYGNNLWDSYEP